MNKHMFKTEQIPRYAEGDLGTAVVINCIESDSSYKAAVTLSLN